MPTHRSTLCRLSVCVTMLLVVTASTSFSDDDQGKRQDGEGQYAQWTAEWWQWVYSLPTADNPLFDETGEKAGVAQPNPKAFYLVGVINVSGTASRSITIPSGTALFGAIINYQNDNVFYDPPVSVPQLRADAAALVDNGEYFLNLNGESRLDLVSRIKSPVFDYVLPDEDNIYQFFGFDFVGRIKPAVSDGYWFYIPPLPPGTHTLVPGGGFPDLGFSLEIEYEITVE